MPTFKTQTAIWLALSLLFAGRALANPLGGVVAEGSASITGQGTATTTITQSTNRAVINWQSFDIGTGEHTDFQQPGKDSITLNRVIGSEQQATQILGKLSANGKVAIVNPNGIVFGKDAQVDVAGLMASTADIGDNDFMAGRGTFDKPGKLGAQILNEGRITVQQAGLAKKP